MIKIDSCEIIRDLLPGYTDEILSETSTNAVSGHLETCEECRQIYLNMKEDPDTEITPKEKIAVDGLKKVRQRTMRLKLITGSVIGLLTLSLLSIFIVFFVMGSPVATHAITADEILYDEETGCLVINGTVNFASCRVSSVIWEQSEEDSNAVNIIVYTAEILPFQKEQQNFTISIPDMAGKKAYFACPDYDRFEIYNWKHYHWETLAKLENEIYENFPELDRTKDALNYTGGIESVNGIDGICYCVDSVIGEDATYWCVNDTLITNGEFESHPFEIWISLEEPHQIYIYDYQTGKYTEDHSVITNN
ncbi:MAG: zf-HC2 domain-containing protein [Lachnospiraceae bacterium]|nr:zf-HC2 domain-containing protein [Lachnospiraceae bacterium]